MACVVLVHRQTSGHITMRWSANGGTILKTASIVYETLCQRSKEKRFVPCYALLAWFSVPSCLMHIEVYGLTYVCRLVNSAIQKHSGSDGIFSVALYCQIVGVMTH